MDWNLLWVPGIALGRGILGWLENALEDKEISLPEWQQLGATIIRMGVPMIALIWGFNIDEALAAGIVVVLDIIIIKIYKAIKNKS
jgi:hypothetical protein